MFKRICTLLILLTAIVALGACSEDGGNDLPTTPDAPDVGFTAASFSHTRTEDSVACTYRLLSSWEGGNPPIAVSWRSASSRFPGTITGDRVDIIINKGATVVSESANIEMSLADKDGDTIKFTQALTFACAASTRATSLAGPQFTMEATPRNQPDFLPTVWGAG